ncbi:putative PAS/PAC sensor protein [Desulfatibacillum aliphaticivorans]|uniref:PAS/PAC sensor protein n=1 Tax=Desulfatibacillum aliphaticivorans TaxID=218208 RepID=B8FFJ8_DESAL|nr:PP2C family protein-serine/threonine phosphatase [Desulfatibacillum aliphaticivorans]ACL04258.1 putative PAS/PAC sensor protein [Desulfatibacillum aliphaticivorans]
MTQEIKELKESREFLNLLLNNINTAVLVVNEEMRIQQVNGFFKSLFGISDMEDPDLTFGQVAGCTFSVEESKGCGNTTNCSQCALRKNLVNVLLSQVPADKNSLSRTFYIDGVPQEKHLEFSTRYIRFHERPMVLVLIYDVTELTLQRMRLSEKQEQVQRDLKSAALIQKGLLPTSANCQNGLELGWKFAPSTHVGGDIFNVLQAPGPLTALYMVDVCGHGVAASLVAVTISQQLQNLSCRHCGGALPLPPAAVLNELEEVFPFERFDTFFTCVYAQVDEARGLAAVSAAGHPAPLLIKRDGTVEKIAAKGPAIGLGSYSKYEQAMVDFGPGDQILLYTDGVTEALGMDDTRFGTERLLEIAAEHGGRPPQELADAVFKAVAQFVGPIGFDDDVSIMTVRYMPAY